MADASEQKVLPPVPVAAWRFFVSRSRRCSRNAIAVFDARSREQITSIATTSPPLGLAVEPNGRRVFVSLPREDGLIVYDAGTRRIISKVEVGLEPDGLVWAP